MVFKNFRHRLADENALLPLSLLGIFTGLLSGIVIQGFRFLIEWPSEIWLIGGHEAFEILSPSVRAVIPIYGALSLGIFLQFIIRHIPSMGLSHVVQRLNEHHGRLPLRPAIMQFLLGAWCILTGQSSGREGPAVHLGAATSSYVGQLWKLPSNSIRVLTGCGTAAAIAASFNTPIAGVIFAMEVVMMEYTIAGFIPIMLSASAGTVISELVYGSSTAFIAPVLEQHTVFEVPAYILLGLGIGIASGLFCLIHKQGLRLQSLPLWLRYTLAGAVTGLLGFYVPEIMGIGYDTLDLALEAQLGFYLLLAIGLAKILATSVSSSLGMPIGIIGPTLLAGGCLGGATGIIINFVAPQTITNDSLYVMLGMGAMMGAVMNAPLAALTALLELTNSPTIILPAMIAIVVATLMNSQILKQKPPHLVSLGHSGERTQLSMFEINLQRIGVSSLMNANMETATRFLTKQQLMALLTRKPRWVITEENQQLIMLNGIQLESGLNEMEEWNNASDEQQLDLLAIPGEQAKIAALSFQSSALEAWQLMQKENLSALYVTGTFDAYAPAISGIITRRDIEDYYQRPRYF